ncbi:MAG: tetratricopeptide repeat protein [Planctomycetota bacterium]
MARKHKRNREPRSLGAAPAETKALVTPQATETAAPRATGRQAWAAAALIVAAGVAAYANSFRGVFLFDDATLLETASLQQPWPPWKCMFCPEAITRPLVGFTLAANYAIGGQEPWGYHAVNLAVHILAGLVLFGLVRRTLASPRLRNSGDTIPIQPSTGKRLNWELCPPNSGAATALALSVTLLWLLHPLQTESVTYVIQRAEAMMGLFYLLTLYCAARAFAAPLTFPSPHGGEGRVRGRGWQVAALIACALGMGCKQVMATAPLLVLLYDRTFAAGSFKAALQRRRRFYAALAATWLIVAAELAFAPKSETAGFGMAQLTWRQYACSQPGVLLHYLRLAFWPDRLCLDYGWPKAESVGEIVLPGVPLFLLLAAAIWALWRAPAWGFLGAWFFLILAPTSSVMPIQDLAFEHRMYLSLAALAGAVSAAVFLAGRKLLGGRVGVPAAAGVAGLLVLGLAWRTIQRNGDYASPVAMWTQVVEQRPTHSRAHYNLGLELSRAGRLEEAIAEYRKAIEIRPDYADAHTNLGNALGKAGQLEEAIAHQRKAIEIKPDFAEAHYNLGNALDKLGQPEEAAAAYRNALKFAPNDAETHNNLAVVLEKLHLFDDAISHAREAARLKPESEAPQIILGKALAGAGRREEAFAAYRKALEISPALTDVRYRLGLLLDEAGRQAEARACFQQLLAAKPAFASDLNDHGIALAKAGRRDEAISQFKLAAQVKPDFANAYNNLGNALDEAGRQEEAVAAYKQALQLQPDYANAHSNLADTLTKLGRSAEAVTHAQEAVRLTPNAAAAHNILGAALLAAGKPGEAAAQFREALRLNPDYAAARSNLAAALQQEDHPAQSKGETKK